MANVKVSRHPKTGRFSYKEIDAAVGRALEKVEIKRASGAKLKRSDMATYKGIISIRTKPERSAKTGRISRKK